jgi:hypothetical protein
MTNTPVPAEVQNHPAVVAAQATLDAAVKTAQSDHAAITQAAVTAAKVTFADEVKAALAKVQAVESTVVKDERAVGRFLRKKVVGPVRVWEVLVGALLVLAVVTAIVL